MIIGNRIDAPCANSDGMPQTTIGPAQILRADTAGEEYLKATVPTRFFGMVASHATSVLSRAYDPRLHKSSLYLMICGEPGSGKTFQAIASCLRAGMTAIYCSTSDLTGVDLGASANAIDEIYDAATLMLRNGDLPVIILDDFHMGEASIGSRVETTVNSNLLTGRLMNYCDDPAVTKIPIVVTANDFSDVNGALLRDGRSRRFNWKPSANERRMIVCGILEKAVGRNEAQRFFSQNRTKPISFFSAVLEECERLKIEISLADSRCTVRDILENPANSTLYGPTTVALMRRAASTLGDRYDRS